MLNATTQLDFGVGTSSTFLQSRTLASAAAPFDFYVGNLSAINLSATGAVCIGGVATGKFDVVAATNKSFRVRDAVAASGGIPSGLIGLGACLELTRPTDGAWATLAWFVVNNADAGYSARSNHRFYSNGTELFTVLESGTVNIGTRFSFDPSIYRMNISSPTYRGDLVFNSYSAVGSLTSGAGFFMGTGLTSSGTANALTKVSGTDQAHFIYTRYDIGIELHTGITG